MVGLWEFLDDYGGLWGFEICLLLFVVVVPLCVLWLFVTFVGFGMILETSGFVLVLLLF